MRTFIVTLMAALLTFTMVVDHAEAGKRFGGGSSIGKSYDAPKKVAPAPKTTPDATGTTASKTQAQAQPVKKGGMMGGLLGGLLAGGLLGALFFGGAFDGIQFMDILMIALLAFVGYKLFTLFRKQRQPQYATGGAQYEIRPEPMQRQAPEMQPQPQPQAQPRFEPMPAFTSGGLGEAELQLPPWFDKQAFLDGARNHFMTLQAAWDKQDWEQIRGYTAPELFEQLQVERAKLAAEQRTEVVSVMAELLNFIDNGDHVIVSINFYGWLKEDSDETTELNEIWHLSRDMKTEGADWHIVGIEQP